MIHHSQEFPSPGHRTGNGKSDKRAVPSQNQAQRDSPRNCCEDEERPLPLIVEDALYFRVVAGPQDTFAGQDFDPAAIARVFQAAFKGVWERLPPADRQRLIAYWRRGPDPCSLATPWQDKEHCPLIRVVCQPTTPEIVLSRLGREVAFPASLVAGQPGRLAWEIARVLAQVFRLSNREHWCLIQTALEEPLEAWERQEGAGATDARRQEKLDELEADYLQRFEASVSRHLRRWKVAAPSC
jgi:hypothetical protein